MIWLDSKDGKSTSAFVDLVAGREWKMKYPVKSARDLLIVCHKIRI